MRAEESQEMLAGIEGATHSTLWVRGSYTLCARKLTSTVGSFCSIRNVSIFLTEVSQWLTTAPPGHSSAELGLSERPGCCVNVFAGRSSTSAYQHALLLTSILGVVVVLMLATIYTRKGTHTPLWACDILASESLSSVVPGNESQEIATDGVC